MKRKAREAKEEAARQKKEQRKQAAAAKKPGHARSRAGIIALAAVATVAIIAGVIIGGKDTPSPSGAADTASTSSTLAPESADTPTAADTENEVKTANNLPADNFNESEQAGVLTVTGNYTLEDFYPVLNASYGGYPVPTPDGSKRLASVTMAANAGSSHTLELVPIITDLLYDQSGNIVGQESRFGTSEEYYYSSNLQDKMYDDKGRLIQFDYGDSFRYSIQYAENMLSYDYIVEYLDTHIKHEGSAGLEYRLKITDRIKETRELVQPSWINCEYQKDGLLTKWNVGTLLSNSCNYQFAARPDGTLSKIEYSRYEYISKSTGDTPRRDPTNGVLLEFDENGYFISYSPLWSDGLTFYYSYEDI